MVRVVGKAGAFGGGGGRLELRHGWLEISRLKSEALAFLPYDRLGLVFFAGTWYVSGQSSRALFTLGNCSRGG